MSTTFHRFLTAGVLTVWGTVLLTIWFTGRICAYLHPMFQPFALTAGITLVCFAFLVLIAPETGAEHGQARRSTVQGLLVSLILVGPLLLAFVNTTDSFGTNAVSNRNYVEDITRIPGAQSTAGPQPAAPVEPPLPDDGTQQTTNAGRSPAPAASPSAGSGSSSDEYVLQKDKEGRVHAEVVDFLYGAELPEVRSQLENKPVEVIGQLMPSKGNKSGNGGCVVIRMMITCCAADARPIAVPLEPLQKPTLPEMSWVKIKGEGAFPTTAGRPQPLIKNAEIEKIDAPDEPYLY